MSEGFFSDKRRAAWLSVASNTLLTAGKVIAGLATGSVSVLSEAAHSAIDLLASVLATFSVHFADRPPDAEHPYGHQKVENVSGVVEGLLIFVAAGWILYESVKRLVRGSLLQDLESGLLVMALSAAVNVAVSTVLRRAAVRHRSVALEADAAHLSTDVWSSAGVFAGLAVITAGRRLLGVSLDWLDPLIAIGVALLILSTAWRITRKSFTPLMDAAASPEEMALLTPVIERFALRGADIHKLRTRRAGGTLHIDLHMGFRPGVSLEEGHGVSHRLRADIEQAVPWAQVLVHVEPSARIEVLPEGDDLARAVRAELAGDPRILEVSDFRLLRFDGELRVEAGLVFDPRVTLAEGHVLTRRLESRLAERFPGVRETVFGYRPGEGWQEALHGDDMEKIRELVGKHRSHHVSLHRLEVTSAAGRHLVRLNLGLPPAMPVAAAHSVARHLERHILALYPEGAEVDLHMEPCPAGCPTCRAAGAGREGLRA